MSVVEQVNPNLPVLRRPERLLLHISDLRKQLEHVESIEELHEATSRLTAVDAYAKARGAREITDRAVETRVWLERRAGEIAIKDGLSTKNIVDKLGIYHANAQRWRIFAGVSPDDLEALIEEVRASRELSMSGLVRRLMRIEEQTQHAGVVRLIDGRFRVRWRAGGSPLHQVLKEGTTLTQARGSLARLKRTPLAHLNSRVAASGPSLEIPYGCVRSGLSSLDKQLPELPADARKVAEEAMTALHKAEDLLAEAMKLS